MKKQIFVSKQKFTVNGKKYTSLDEMPEDVRNIIDKDRNGILDVIEDTNERNSTTSININGKSYGSWNEVPAKYQKYKNFGRKLSTKPEQKDKIENQHYKKEKPYIFRQEEPEKREKFPTQIIIFIIAMIGIIIYLFRDEILKIFS